jgi:undecaprenyl-diphosphatase
MSGILANVVALDHGVVEAGEALRWGPLTAVFVVLSAWWVKGPLYVIAGLASDLKRKVVPVTAIAVTAAVVAGDALSSGIKHLVDRARPPLDDALITVPTSPSFPSGHATTAFAAAAVISVLSPRLRRPAFALAALVAASRVYLGVHYALDVLAGAALGTLVGLAIGLGARRAATAVAAPLPAA